MRPTSYHVIRGELSDDDKNIFGRLRVASKYIGPTGSGQETDTIDRDKPTRLRLSSPVDGAPAPVVADLTPLPEQPSKRGVTRKLPTEDTVTVIGAPENDQLDYEVRTKSEVITAKKTEAELLNKYTLWLKQKGRELLSVKYGGLQCDGYEDQTRNLIEAKSSTRREHIRMAVGQLLDYAFQGRKELGASNKAILLPEKPKPAAVKWLEPLRIKIIWREGDSFLDNAAGQFS